MLILPHAGHISEFVTDAQGTAWNGTCTQTALEICLAVVEGREPAQAHMVQLTRDMIAKGICGANGAATLWAVAREARDTGHGVALEWDYQQPLQGDWHKALLDNAGLRPILLQVANGQALVDTETGSRDESSLHYHAIAVVGRQDNGYICADGDNPQVSERFQIYPYETLANAVPCGLLILDMPASASTALLPAGWTDDGAALHAPNGHVVVRGFRHYCLEHPEVLRLFGRPIEDEHAEADVGDDGYWGAGTRQMFEAGGLIWVQRTGAIFPIWAGMLWVRDSTRLKAMQAQEK